MGYYMVIYLAGLQGCNPDPVSYTHLWTLQLYSAMFVIVDAWNRGEKASGTMLDKISRQPHRVSPAWR